jgi:hypothetical protein
VGVSGVRTVQALGRVVRRAAEEREIGRRQLLKRRQSNCVCLGSWLERWQSALSCVGILGRGGCGSCRCACVSRGELAEHQRDLLLLKVILSRTTSLAAWERALVVPFTSVHAGVASEVSTRRERTITRLAHMFLFLCWRGSGGCDARRRRVSMASGRGRWIRLWHVVIVVERRMVELR